MPQDPRTAEPVPPFSGQKQPAPGLSSEMSPEPDHGEYSYRGSYLPQEESDAQETARWVRDAGRHALLLPGDITDEALCRELVERTVRDLGKLDILVNNAATQQIHKSLDQIGTEDIERTYRTNVFAMFHLCEGRFMTGALVPVTGGKPML